jgi:hypothetical protein
MGETARMILHGTLAFGIYSAMEIIEVRCNVSSAGFYQRKVGTLKEADQIIQATSIRIDGFRGFLELAEKGNPLPRMFLLRYSRIEVPAYLIHEEMLLRIAFPYCS